MQPRQRKWGRAVNSLVSSLLLCGVQPVLAEASRQERVVNVTHNKMGDGFECNHVAEQCFK